MTAAEVIFSVATGAPIAVWLIVLHRIFTHLSKVHPDAFSALGSPHLLMNNTPGHSKAIWEFVVKKGHLSLADDKLDRMCSLARVSLFVGASVLILYIAAVVLAMVGVALLAG